MARQNNVLPITPPAETIAIVGNPNCGKTTLFNALTGSSQRVGNWSGVTVERISGICEVNGEPIEIIDLPGTYTLVRFEEEGPQDENITSQFLKDGHYSLILNVVDALAIERNLYLTLQCLEQDKPVVIALNRMDLAAKAGKEVCVKTLSEYLGCQVIPIVARNNEGLELLKAELVKPQCPMVNPKLVYPQIIEDALVAVREEYTKHSLAVPHRYQIIRWLKGEECPKGTLCEKQIGFLQEQIRVSTRHTPDVIIAKARYDFIEMIVSKAIQDKAVPQKAAQTFSQFLDKITSHRLLGLPCFLLAMYGLFFFAINIGGAFQDFFEITSEAIFVEGLAHVLNLMNTPHWLIALLVSGVGKGICTVVTFVPVIGAMFLALSFLEDCGYMARAAFVMDRFMRALGLPGKSFVPMIIGFGCNVPAIMGMRTLANQRDRILAVMMSPFMSCGARLAIFTVFVAAFFHEGGQNIVFLLYLIGIGMAILTGLLLKNTLLKGEVAPLLLEIPDYQWPQWQSLRKLSWLRLRRFVLNAGRLIIPVCIIIGVLNHIDHHGRWLDEPAQQTSLLATVGKQIVPVFAPLGIEEDNWPAAVGLITGVLAKEVVIGTLNSLYADPKEEKGTEFHLAEHMHEAFMSIGKNLLALRHAWQNPIKAKSPETTMLLHAHGEMVKRFDGKANAFAYLLFVLLYFPCISATAAMVREVQKGWTIFSVCWTTGLAYAVAVFYYQAATFMLHPLQSIAWGSGLTIIGFLAWHAVRYYSTQVIWRTVPTPIVVLR